MSFAKRFGHRKFDVDRSDLDDSEHAASWHPLAAVIGRDAPEQRLAGYRVVDAPPGKTRPVATRMTLEDDSFEAADEDASAAGDIPLIASWQLRELAPARAAHGDPDEVRWKGSKIMTALALADLVGAVEQFLKTNFPGVTLADLPTFAASTRRALESGHLALRAD